MSRSALFGADAQTALVKGAHLVRDAVKVTMGPKGKTVVIQQGNGKAPIITKDGVSVAREIKPKDEKIAIGSQLVCSVANKAMDTAGDGTTTSTVLAGAIIDEGMKYTSTNASLSEIRRGVEYAKNHIVEELKKISTPIQNDMELTNIATISANGDEKLGKLVAEAYAKVGKDGVVTVEESKDRDIVLEFTEGMRLDRGWTSPYFVTNFEENTVEYDDPLILLADSKISNLQQLVNIINPVIQQGKNLVIIAEGFETNVTDAMIMNRLRGGLKIACVEAPGYGNRRTEILRDLGIYLGCPVADDVMGVKMDEMSYQEMGTCEKIIIKKDETIIRGGKGKKEDIDERIATLQKQLEVTDIPYEKEKLKERLGSLTTGVATIRVGGSSEEEIKELKDRLDDAMWSVKSALEEGYVPGSGRTLAYLADRLDINALSQDLTDDQIIGVKILKKALYAPFSTILSNADENPSLYLKDLEQEDITTGYNVRNMEKVNLVEAGIIDATKVVRCALEAASSIASLVLNTTVVITQDPEDKNGVNITGVMPPNMM
jgi:chaperonin GroEL